jgi:hypothetical protein
VIWFAGSYSLKYVLPALIPEMTYKGMAVANGQEAAVAWEALVQGNLDGDERDRSGKRCWIIAGRTRWRMVRLLDNLRTLRYGLKT